MNRITVFYGVLILVYGFTAFAGEPAAPPLKILALGDSYTIGESVAAKDRFPVKLAELLRAGGEPAADPVIIARTGWTTRALIDAIAAEKPVGTFEIVTLLIGVNNQFRGRDEKEYRTEFVLLLQEALKFAGQSANRVIVVSIPDWGATPFARGRDSAKIAGEIDRFNQINKEESEKAKVKYVEITEHSRQARTDATLIAADGLHPSTKMYAHWAKSVFEALKK